MKRDNPRILSRDGEGRKDTVFRAFQFMCYNI